MRALQFVKSASLVKSNIHKPCDCLLMLVCLVGLVFGGYPVGFPRTRNHNHDNLWSGWILLAKSQDFSDPILLDRSFAVSFPLINYAFQALLLCVRPQSFGLYETAKKSSCYVGLLALDETAFSWMALPAIASNSDSQSVPNDCFLLLSVFVFSWH